MDFASILGAESLRVEFDRQSSTERRHDPLIIMDGQGRHITTRSGILGSLVIGCFLVKVDFIEQEPY